MKTEWSTSRKDLDSFTANPETGKTEHVVYIYRDPEQRIAVFGKRNREHAEEIVKALDAVPAKELIINTLLNYRDALMDERDALEGELESVRAVGNETQMQLRRAQEANKEMGDAIEYLAKEVRLQGNAGQLCKAVAEELISLRARRPAIRALIDAIESCQDWRGTHVGDCIEILEAFLDNHPPQPATE